MALNPGGDQALKAAARQHQSILIGQRDALMVR